ncbi:MAG: pilus assembly protein TadG-related protein [Pseudomonadota bacterium]
MTLRVGSAHFSRDTRGTIAILMGIVAFVVVLVVGLAIDYGRTINTKSLLQRAADAAVEAGSLMVLDTNAAISKRVRSTFKANLPPDLQNTTAFIHIAKQPLRVRMNVSRQVPTTFMALAGFQHVNVEIVARAKAPKIRIKRPRQVARDAPPTQQRTRELMQDILSGKRPDPRSLPKPPADLGQITSRQDMREAARRLQERLRKQLEAAQRNGQLRDLKLPPGFNLSR